MLAIVFRKWAEPVNLSLAPNKYISVFAYWRFCPQRPSSGGAEMSRMVQVQNGAKSRKKLIHFGLYELLDLTNIRIVKKYQENE